MDEQLEEQLQPEGSEGEAAVKPKKDFLKSVFEWIELFAVSVAIVMTVLVCVARHSPVIGESMRDTLQQDDLLIISSLFYTPERGDIVVFENEDTTYLKPYVKRVIATEGQKVRIENTELGMNVWVDGHLIIEGYAYYAGYPRPMTGYAISEEITVPEGQVFVMGDNRWNSTDSRILGTIDVRCIIGRVVIRVLPVRSFGTVS